jgi:V8-like Glu-specific endopeptidase
MIRRVTCLTALTVLLTSWTAFAQPGPVIRVSPSDITQATAAIEMYWTPERMQKAIPRKMHVLERSIAPQSAREEVMPFDLIPGIAPGWPARGRQPAAGLQFQIAPDGRVVQDGTLILHDLPQISPPFGPPSSPTDRANHAPFQRWGAHNSTLTVYPYSTIGKLFFTQRGTNFVCSASVINRSTLATAGHCVHDGSNSAAGWSTNVLFCPSFLNGQNAARGCWAHTALATSFQWFNAANIDRDYGCIVTRTTGTRVANRVGNVTGWLGRAWNFASRQAELAFGYPQAAPFNGQTLQVAASTEWYQLNRNTSEAQLSKYIGNDMTGGSSGGPWTLNWTGNNERTDTDASSITDPFQSATATPFLNGINSHKRCTTAGCPAGSIFTQEMGSPQFRNTAGDNNESEDIFQACFGSGGLN